MNTYNEDLDYVEGRKQRKPKKANNEVNHDRFVGEGKKRKLKSNKAERHQSKQQFRDYLDSNDDWVHDVNEFDNWDDDEIDAISYWDKSRTS